MITVIPGKPNPAPAPEPQRNAAGSVVREYRLGQNPPAEKKAVKKRPPGPPKDVPDCFGISNKEKGLICAAANAAFDHLVATSQMDLPFPPNLSLSKRREYWRHAELEASFRLASLTLASHQQFNDIISHFENMMPAQAGKAFGRQMRGDGDANKKRIALHKIREACQSANLHFPGYPLSIATTQFKVRSLDALSAKQAWALFYTMTNRSRAKFENGRSKQGKTTADHPF